MIEIRLPEFEKAIETLAKLNLTKEEIKEWFLSVERLANCKITFVNTKTGESWQF